MNKRDWSLTMVLNKRTHRLLELVVVKERNRVHMKPDDNHVAEWWQTRMDMEIEILNEDDRYDIDDDSDIESQFELTYGGNSKYVDGKVLRHPVSIWKRDYVLLP